MASRHSSYPVQSDALAALEREFHPSRAHLPPSNPLEGDQGEELAEKIIQVGSDYIVHKSEERYTQEELHTGATAAALADPVAVANKIIKEGAREMERAEGHPSKGGQAAQAQRVAAKKDDPSAPEHAVAEKIRERVAAAEDHATHPTFVGPNPDKGAEPNNTKVRHLRDIHQHVGLSGGFRSERNPDVLPPKGAHPYYTAE